MAHCNTIKCKSSRVCFDNDGCGTCNMDTGYCKPSGAGGGMSRGTGLGAGHQQAQERARAVVAGEAAAEVVQSQPYVHATQRTALQDILAQEYRITTVPPQGNQPGGTGDLFLDITAAVDAMGTVAGAAAHDLLELNPAIFHIHLFPGTPVPGIDNMWNVRMSIRFEVHDGRTMHVGHPRGGRAWQTPRRRVDGRQRGCRPIVKCTVAKYSRRRSTAETDSKHIFSARRSQNTPKKKNQKEKNASSSQKEKNASSSQKEKDPPPQ